MKRFSYILSLIPSVLISVGCFSQQVIATAGGSGSGTGIELSWTIGEPVTATAHGANFYLTQGFHQSQPITAMFNHELSFSAGWNIASARVIPGNKNLMDIFWPLIDAGILKKVMDETGKTLEDWGVYGGWKNEIGDLMSTEGYKVNVNTPTTLSITGTTFLFSFLIPLKAGWNIISWPSPVEQDGLDVFKTLINENKLIKVMDETGKVIEDWGIYGGWQNNIGNLTSGEGYKVNVMEDCTLTINETGTKSEVIVQELIPSIHFIPAFKGNGTDHMNINLVNLAESGIMEGDEIGIFDGNICVGSAKIVTLYSAIGGSSISIPVSAEDGIEGKNGYSDGNPVIVKLFRSDKEYVLTIEPLKNSQPVFKKGSSLYAQLALPTGLEAIIKGGFTNLNVYPNPFNKEVNIEINLADDSEVAVAVLNQLGQRVKMLFNKQYLTNGTHLIKWDGRNSGNQSVSPGIYLLRVNIDETFIYRKVLFSK